MFLQTTVIGNLGKDAYITDYQGKKVINFSVAHTETYKNALGVEVKNTTWVECAMWQNEAVAPYLKKGTLVQVIGTPKSQAFVTKEGEMKASLKIGVVSLKLLSAAKKEDAAPSAAATHAPAEQATEPVAESVDGLPFP